MTTFNKKWLAVAAGLVLSSASALANHIPSFTFSPEQFNVNPSSLNTVPGALAPETTGPFVAGSITFDYRGLVSQGAGTGSGASASSPFAEMGTARFASFFDMVGGSPLPAGDTGLNLSSGTNGYRLYATFLGTGTATVNGAGGIDGLFNTFNVSIFVDKNNNTTFNAAGTQTSTAPTGGAGEDMLVLTGNLQVGGFHVFGGLANGDFDVIFNVTSFGAAPLFSTTVDGQPLTQGEINGVNSRTIGLALPPAAFANGEIDGSGNVQFQSVPEPASLALVGLALAGIGLARKKKAA